MSLHIGVWKDFRGHGNQTLDFIDAPTAKNNEAGQTNPSQYNMFVFELIKNNPLQSSKKLC